LSYRFEDGGNGKEFEEDFFCFSERNRKIFLQIYSIVLVRQFALLYTCFCSGGKSFFCLLLFCIKCAGGRDFSFFALFVLDKKSSERIELKGDL